MSREDGPVYSVNFKGQPLIEDSPLGLVFEGGERFQAGLEPGDPEYSETDETYSLLVGKTSGVRSHFREARVELKEVEGRHRRMELVVRIFDDGIAFRYEFPQQQGWESYVLEDELTAFRMSGDPFVRTLLFEEYINWHEGIYKKLPLSQIEDGLLLDLPALFEYSGQVYMAVTEANLRDYAGMYLSKKEGLLQCQLTPLPGQEAIKVRADLPHRTPWRVLMISDQIGALVESNILTSLCPPSRISDTSWIHPGKTTFHWWNGDIVPDTNFAPGANFKTNQYYIDFCARNGIDYHAVIGYGGFAWYRNDWAAYGKPGTYADVTKPVPSLDLERVCAYARERGVGIHVWVHWEALYPQLEEAFTQFEKWGIKGMMVDFLNRSDQEMVRIQEEILQRAAAHKLYIQYHGSYKPTGLHRTYPNMFTREGARNYEYNKWSKYPVKPEYDLDVAFTRLLAGPTDYHMGGFRAVPEEDFKIQYTRPLVLGTRAHMLAMYVVLESYLAMVADYPEAYEGQEGFEFIKAVPTTWDETRVLAAEVDHYLVIARRKGDNWYLGAINDQTPRRLEIPLRFLGQGRFTADIYADHPEVGENPNQVLHQRLQLGPEDVLTLELAPGGGQAVQFALP